MQWSLLLAAFAAAPALADETPVQVAVLPIKAREGVRESVGAVFTEQLAAAIQARGFSVMSPDGLAARLGFERQKELLGCTDTTCLAEVGQALGVDRLVSGGIAVVGQSIVVNLAVIDNRSGAVEHRYSDRVKGGTDEAFLDLVPAAVAELFPQAKAQAGKGGPSALRVAAFVTLGLAVASLATGATFFALARGAQGEVTVGNPMPYLTLQEKVAAGKTKDAVGVTGLVAGGALAVASVVLFVLGPSSPQVAIGPVAGGGALVSFGGSF
jgi:TolB-like protein